MEGLGPELGMSWLSDPLLSSPFLGQVQDSDFWSIFSCVPGVSLSRSSSLEVCTLYTSPSGNIARTRGASVGTPSVGAWAMGPAKVTDPDCFSYSNCNGCPHPAHMLLQA